ncbi:MAG: 4a-hydroxytetrahydrobiopterin dehydratase [Pseudomonadota bacterium]|nr:4a-hydroxytetrahydrobiopterin dehydratase [Pseudomonadota bacterium]
MSDLIEKSCKPCEGGVETLTPDQMQLYAKQIPAWKLNENGTWITRDFSFKNYYQTMAFVNAIAWIANKENHHPNLEVGYGKCLVKLSTHAIHGLSENDFIIAAKIDSLIS